MCLTECEDTAITDMRSSCPETKAEGNNQLRESFRSRGGVGCVLCKNRSLGMDSCVLCTGENKRSNALRTDYGGWVTILGVGKTNIEPCLCKNRLRGGGGEGRADAMLQG